MVKLSPRDISTLREVQQHIAVAKDFARRCQECGIEVSAELAELSTQEAIAQNLLKHFSESSGEII